MKKCTLLTPIRTKKCKNVQKGTINMKRIEHALDQEWADDYTQEEIIEQLCVQEIDLDIYNAVTEKYDQYTGLVCGCNGITCEECWNIQMK